MKKEYTLFDLLTMGIGSMAAVESDNMVTRLAILGGTVAWIESKNALCDKLSQYKAKRAEAKILNPQHSDSNSLKGKIIKAFYGARGLYYPKDLALEEVKRSDFSLEAREKYLRNHSAFVFNTQLRRIRGANQCGTPLPAEEIKKLRDAVDRSRRDAYKEILSLKFENIR